MHFIIRHSFIIFASVISLALLSLLKLSYPYIAENLLSANISTPTTIEGELSDTWQISLRTHDDVLAPSELFIVDVVSLDPLALISADMRFRYPGSLLKLVRISTDDSVMHYGDIPAEVSYSQLGFHSTALNLRNDVFNGSDVPEGHVARLYFVALKEGEGSLGISRDTSSLTLADGSDGFILGRNALEFRID